MNELLRIGELMSNVFFNWSQQERFTADEKKMMKSLQVQWDAARLIAKTKRTQKPARKPQRAARR
jgi:hypothetical protein